MLIGIPAETTVGETGVAVTSETAQRYVSEGHSVAVQSGADLAAC